jgi:excisionase family DNA binding protein
MKDIKQDLIDRLLLLRSRYEVAFHVNSDAGPREIELYAGVIEKGLHDGLDSALRAVRAIVDPADTATAAFWQTPLGVLFFAAGGFEADEMPQTLAASLLGCSRQYISEMVKNGKLVNPGTGAARRRMVRSEAVRELLRRKLDRFVN